MNNFPAMTEERRQALIDALEILKPEISESPALYKAVEISLAALTANPVGYIQKHVWHEYKQAVCTGGEEGKEMYSNSPSHFPVYTSPPAPVPRVAEGWIKCIEMMPLHRQSVFGWQPNTGNVIECYREGIKWFYHYSDAPCGTITHWMPPPSPPEGSNEQ